MLYNYVAFKILERIKINFYFKRDKAYGKKFTSIKNIRINFG